MMLSLRRHKKKHRPLAEINVVPYIDVMLVLLVIFMITAPLLTQGVTVDLPRAKAAALPPKQQEPMVISVDAAGNYFLNIAALPNQPITAPNLLAKVSAAYAARNVTGSLHRDVFIKGDHRVNYGAVMRVMTLLQEAGINNVGLLVNPIN